MTPNLFCSFIDSLIQKVLLITVTIICLPINNPIDDLFVTKSVYQSQISICWITGQISKRGDSCFYWWYLLKHNPLALLTYHCDHNMFTNLWSIMNNKLQRVLTEVIYLFAYQLVKYAGWMIFLSTGHFTCKSKAWITKM